MLNDEVKYKFIIFNIQKNYNFLSYYLISLKYHINYLYNFNIISLYKRNLVLNDIYKEIKNLNNGYNNNILNNVNNYIKIIDDYLFDYNKFDEDYFIYYRDLLKNIFNISYDSNLNRLLYSLDKNRYKIIKLSEDYGCKNIKIILEVVYKLEVKKVFNNPTNIFIHFLNKIFLPIQFKINNNKIKINSNLCDEESYEFFTKYVKIKYNQKNKDELLSKFVDITIIHNTGNIIISGIFKNDSINIILKTCQISNKFLYYKKKQLEKCLIKCRAAKKFTKNFMKILTLDEILCYEEKSFVDFIDTNYDKYMILISKTFMSIMKDFIKKNNTITEMFTCIRLLLLGNEENVNIGGLLFELTKDKKINSTLIYDLIYDNLHYIQQIKIKKTVSDIKSCLKKIQSISNNDMDFKKQILSLKFMPLSVKSLALEKIDEMKSNNNEYYKQQLYVKTLIKFPWSSLNEDAIFTDLNNDLSKRQFYISNIEKKLTLSTYGHQETKKSLIQIIAKWISNPESGGSTIALCGPPGVGKTLLARNVSDILNVPFCHIALGGQNDGELLHGHGYTYSGSQPGLIIKKISDMGKARVIIYFDELDKVCSKNGSNEIFNILIHLTDPNMNNSFQDRFFQGIDFPLNKVIYIFSYNDRSKIDHILLDRFNQIDIKPYSLDDKVCLFKQFLFKEVVETIGFKTSNFKITDNNIKFIINNYTLEAGVRELKRKIEKIILILNVDRLFQRNLFACSKKNKVVNLSRNLIKKLLDTEKFDFEKIHNEPMIGIVNGLYATNSGYGGIVPIQVSTNFFNNDSPFSLRLTGSQGDVMKESVQCALTCAVNYIDQNKDKYKIEDLKEHIHNKWKSGFHIHAPNGATPKDGPSAGCAFTLAFISTILQKKIRNDIGMTGEIDLIGNISKIGGLEFKINGAKKAGVKTIFISHENKQDFDKIKKEDNKIDTDVKIIFIKNINDLVDQGLIL